MIRLLVASPGRLAGCGLKPEMGMDWVRIPVASPGRLAGCGLKLSETESVMLATAASPGRLAGCGLKPYWRGPQVGAQRITRPVSRVRIETIVVVVLGVVDRWHHPAG